MPRRETIQVRRDTAANWTSRNPTLAAGEVGFETDALKAKIGDGSTAWTSLRYLHIPASTAAGDLAYYSAATTPARLAIGTAYQVLRTNSGATAPEWVSGGMHLISETDLSGSQANFDLTSIPTGFRHLHLRIILRSDANATSDNVNVAFNGDTTAANYNGHYAVFTGGVTTQGDLASSRVGFFAIGATAGANDFAAGTIDIHHYAAGHNKELVGTQTLPTGAAVVQRAETVVRWSNTAVISRITLTPVTGTNFVSGSRVSLYGIG